jgi:hypothetical protein
VVEQTWWSKRAAKLSAFLGSLGDSGEFKGRDSQWGGSSTACSPDSLVNLQVQTSNAARGSCSMAQSHATILVLVVCLSSKLAV